MTLRRRLLVPAGAIALVLVAVGVWLVRSSADDHDLDLRAPADLADTVAAIDAVVPRTLDEAAVPGAAVAVVRDGSTVWSAGFGFATPGGAEITPETVFQVGSISKPVAAATILALVSEGTLDLDSPVLDVLRSWRVPEEYADPDAVTLRSLLSHTAGIDTPGYLGLPADRPLPTTVESLSGATTGSPVAQDKTPGEYAYSGGGYTIAQLVAEDVTGRPFAELAQQYVFDPLAMTATNYSCTRSPDPDPAAAVGHDADGAPTPRYRYAEAAAAGVCTTATDLAKFAAWLASDDPRAELMRTPAAGTGGDYGLGLEIYAGGTIGHLGVNRGFDSRLLVDADDDLALLVMTNGDNGARVADAVLDAWQG
jgi:CubicO group peptidase (beta-lactamase class C family)